MGKFITNRIDFSAITVPNYPPAGSFIIGLDTADNKMKKMDSAGAITIINEAQGHKIYRALLNQSGTNAPTATILENTLGVTPTFSYTSSGKYVITAAGVFDSSKTFVMIGGISIRFGTDVVGIRCKSLSSPNTLGIDVMDVYGVPINDILIDHPIEIIVYP